MRKEDNYMTQDEFLNKCKTAEAKYIAEIAKISQEYFASKLPFRIGDVIEFKNYVNSGYILVEHLFFKNLKEFMDNPYEYNPTIYIEGRKVNADGSFQHILSHYNNTRCSENDFVRIVNIRPHE